MTNFLLTVLDSKMQCSIKIHNSKSPKLHLKETQVINTIYEQAQEKIKAISALTKLNNIDSRAKTKNFEMSKK